MRRVAFITLLLLLLLTPLMARDDELEPHNLETMLAKIYLTRQITADFPITEATFLSYEYPVDTIKEEGDFEKLEDEYGSTYIKMDWLDTDDLSYEHEMRVETAPPELISYSPEFPKKYEGFDEYLAPGRYTPTTIAIRKEANEIVYGSETVFEAASRLALWVHNNIEYDTSYGGRILTSEETFEERKGTCDEFSHLFISMARSVGIPARYVSGITYGTFGVEGGGEADWYSHGWAEVYIDGWVPFDPTYGEIGYVDGSHIKIAHAPDQKDLESYMTWRPDKSNVDIGNWDYRIEVLESSNYSEPLQKVSLELIPDKIGFEEYVLAKITSTPSGCNGQGLKFVYNDNNEESPNFSIERGESFMMVIGCDEPVVKYVIVKSPGNLDSDFTYQYELLAYNNQDEVRAPLVVTPKMEEAPVLKLTLEEISVKPDAPIKVYGIVESNEKVTVYLFDDKKLLTEETVEAGKNTLTWTIMNGEAGLHSLYLYSSRALAKASYSVEESGPLTIEITGPNLVEPGNQSIFDVKVSGELYTEAIVIFDLFTTQNQEISLSGTEPESVSFVVDIPETDQNKVYATVQVISSGTSAHAIKEIDVYHRPPPKAEGFREKLSMYLGRFIDNLKYFIRRITNKF